jgi:hypothetical protein
MVQCPKLGIQGRLCTAAQRITLPQHLRKCSMRLHWDPHFCCKQICSGLIPVAARVAAFAAKYHAISKCHGALIDC